MKPEVDIEPLSLKSLPLQSTSDPYATTYSIGLKLLVTMGVSNRERMFIDETAYVEQRLCRQLFEKLYGHLRGPIHEIIEHSRFTSDYIHAEEGRRLSDALWKAFNAPLEGASTLTGEQATETPTT